MWIDEIKFLGEGKHSQFNEDTIIEHIFENIGTTNKFLVDLGAGGYGQKMSNSRHFIENGWKGYGVDMSEVVDSHVIRRFIEPETILSLLDGNETPLDLDLLLLDIDSCDFWVLKEILTKYEPRVIVTEYNGCLEPSKSVVLEYQKGYTWNNTDKYGYSFAAGVKLLERNGYTVIYNQHNVNLFAVRADLVPKVEVTAKRHQYHRHDPTAKFIPYE